jgi:hypothetical protein
MDIKTFKTKKVLKILDFFSLYTLSRKQSRFRRVLGRQSPGGEISLKSEEMMPSFRESPVKFSLQGTSSPILSEICPVFGTVQCTRCVVQ